MRSKEIILSVAVFLVATGCGNGAPTPASPEEALAGVLAARRQVQQLGLVQADRDSYRRGETRYREALAEAKAGDLRNAAESAEAAVEYYRTAVLASLEEGPVRQALAKFEMALPNLSGRQRRAAEQEASRLERLLPELRGSQFEIGPIADEVLEVSFLLERTLVEQLDLLDPGPCSTLVQPKFLQVVVSAASPGTLLTRSSLHYVAGGEVDVTLVVPVCTFLSEISVEVGGISHRLVSDASVYDPIEGIISNPFYYSVIDPPLVDGDQMSLRLRLHFPAYGDGRTLVFRLTLEPASGPLSAVEHTIFVVSVTEVDSQQAIGLSEHQLQNDFVARTYKKFGDSGRKEQDGIDLIDPSYSALTVDVTPSGVHYSSKMKVDLPICDPTISAHGTFHLEKEEGAAEVLVEWDSGPSAGVTLPPACELAATALEPIRTIVRSMFENWVEDEVEDEVQGRIDDLIAEIDTEPFDPAAFIDHFEMVDDQIIVFLKIDDFDAVAIEVPYSRLRPAEAETLGMALNLGDQVLILASGLVDVCGIDGSAPDGCARKKTGPAGLFNWSVDVPVPDPWPCFDDLGVCATFEERLKARKRLEGFRRYESELPFPTENVGALIARLVDDTSWNHPDMGYRFAGEGCTIEATLLWNRLAFGANDYRYADAAEFGTGTWHVTVTWLPIALEGCATRPTLE